MRAWIDRYAPAGAPLLVACSGGTDSLALAVAVRRAVGARSDGRTIAAVTVDHGLQDGSAARAARVHDDLLALGYSHVDIRTVVVDGPGGPEAAARRARYAALRAAATEQGAAAVLLAHTRDDQAETVLLGLARGSGPRSIAGMRPWRPPWGRPLLDVGRADTEAACRAAGLYPWDDPHNLDPAFTRVRLRREVLPLLEDVLGGGAAAALARTADLLAGDLQALDELAGRALSSARRPDRALDAAALAGEPAAVRTRVLRRWLAEHGITTLTADHLRRLDRRVSRPAGAERVRLPGGFDVHRVGHRLHLTPLADRQDRDMNTPLSTPEGPSGSVDHQEGIAKVAELVKDARIAMLTTMTSDGKHLARPMALQEVEFDGDLWFFVEDDSDKVTEIQANPSVNVSFSNQKNTAWTSIAGTAEIVHDKAKAKDLWSPVLNAWFPDGLDSPNLALIKVHADSAEYWDGPGSRMVQLLGILRAAVTRNPDNMIGQENETVEL